MKCRWSSNRSHGYEGVTFASSVLRPMAPAGDRFDPDRIGLDHLRFGVASREDLEQAVRLFDEHGVTHGVITRLAGFGIDVLPFEDPDGIQLELTAPAAPAADRDG